MDGLADGDWDLSVLEFSLVLPLMLSVDDRSLGDVLLGVDGAPTVSLQVDYLHGMPLGCSYTARGEVVRAGKATAIVDVHVYDPDELLVARGKCYFQLPSAWRERRSSGAEGART